MTIAGAITELRDQLSELKATKETLLKAPPARKRRAKYQLYSPGHNPRLAAIEAAITHVEHEIERLSKFDPKASRQSA